MALRSGHGTPRTSRYVIREIDSDYTCTSLRRSHSAYALPLPPSTISCSTTSRTTQMTTLTCYPRCLRLVLCVPCPLIPDPTHACRAKMGSLATLTLQSIRVLAGLPSVAATGDRDKHSITRHIVTPNARTKREYTVSTGFPTTVQAGLTPAEFEQILITIDDREAILRTTSTPEIAGTGTASSHYPIGLTARTAVPHGRGHRPSFSPTSETGS